MDTAVVDELLTTTRAVRKRLDLERGVPDSVVMDCLRLAIQAPTGSNMQGWRWMVVKDPGKREALADLYRRAFYDYRDMMAAAMPDRAADLGAQRIRDSAEFLADNLHRVPIHVVPCILGRPGAMDNITGASLYGSIVPAVWSFQLALRSRGLGSAYTTLHLTYENDAAEILEIPDSVTQVALIPVAYTQGTDFKPAPRRPIEKITYLDSWRRPFPPTS